MFGIVNSHFIFENCGNALEADSPINEIVISSVKMEI